MDRRQFFKSVAAVCAGVVVAPAVSTRINPYADAPHGMPYWIWKCRDKSVVYGVAAHDVCGPGYYTSIDIGVGWPRVFEWEDHYVIVKSAAPIKKGQKLRWFPDGTIMGV